MSVRCGVFVNNRAAAFLEGFGLADLVDMAREAEESGFDFVSVGDSLQARPRYSPVPTLAAIAARTRRIGLATGILQPHLRHPAVLAQEWTTLDVLSAGRTELGVGLGGGSRALVEAEYGAVRLDVRRRGRAFSEAIAVLRDLWDNEVGTFTGEIFSSAGLTLGLRPAAGRPPILVASRLHVPERDGTAPFSAATDMPGTGGPLDRVAGLADGWITQIETPTEVERSLAVIREIAAQRYGRDLGEDFDVRLNVFVCVGDDVGETRETARSFLQRYHGVPFDDETVERSVVHGPPGRCLERLAPYADVGVTSMQFVLAADAQRETQARVAEDLLPVLRG